MLYSCLLSLVLGIKLSALSTVKSKASIAHKLQLPVLTRLKTAGYKVTTAGSRLLLLVKKLMLRNYQEESFTHKEEMAPMAPSDSESVKEQVGIKQYEINTLKAKFEKLKQEKDAIDFKIEKFVESPVVVKKKTVFPTVAKIEFVRPKQHEKPVRKPVKYAEMYRSQRLRGNQRNWNNQKSQQLGSDFVMIKKACYVCGSFEHLQDDLEDPSKQGRTMLKFMKNHLGSDGCTESGEAGVTAKTKDN
ncbi:hypothetical protein Tco_1360292 [Tanacetum coccineum]